MYSLIDRDIATMKVDDYSIRYVDTGKNKSNPKISPLLLLHGLGGSLDRWSEAIPFLSKYYRLLVPDIIGFGYSDKPHAEYNMDFFIKFIQRFLQIMDIDNLHIIGSSFGGLLALEYTIRFPKDINKLVLISPAGMMNHITPALNQYISAALYPTFYNVATAYYEMVYDPRMITEDSIQDFIKRMNLSNSKFAFMSTLISLKNHPQLTDRLNINTPTLIIWGRNDKLMPLRYAKKFQIPNSKLVIFDQCGHYPHVEKAEKFNRTVSRFLNGRRFEID